MCRARGNAVSEYEQWLLDGDVDVAIALLRRLAGQITRTRSFPPPAGYVRWHKDAVDELLVEMIERKGVAFLLGALVSAIDQCSVERYLLATVENFLRDQAKATPHGKLRARLETVLGADSRFEPVSTPTGGWRLAGGPEDWWQGDISTLERAALRVRGVSIPSWNKAGPTPRVAREALTTVAAAVLASAGGIVRAEGLARVLLERFRHAIAPETVGELFLNDVAEQTAPADDEPEQVFIGVAAQELWTAFTPAQRAVVPYLTAPQDAPAALGIGPKEANALVAQVIEVVRLATVDDPRAEAVVAALLDIGILTPTPELARPSRGGPSSTEGRMGR
jgi:hypothetical protein